MAQGTAVAESRKVGDTELVTVGIDVSDRYSHLCILGDDGEILREERVRTTTAALTRALARMPGARVVMEVGPRSPWLSRMFTTLGHDVIVANPVPRSRDSGDRQPQLRITKDGDAALRRVLNQAAHYILGPFGPDSDLRRWGLRYAESGAGNAKKRAVVAVARRLAVLLLALWKNGEVYEPLRQARAAEAA